MTARGYTLIEVALALFLTASVLALALPLAGSAAEGRHNQLVLAAAQDILQSMHAQFTSTAGGYPAGADVAAQVQRAVHPGEAFDPGTGCWTLDGTTSLCLWVPDAGDGRGPEPQLTYHQTAGGKRASTCRLLAEALQPAAYRMEVAGDQPVDAQGYWLHGAAWDTFWARCDSPIDITFALR